MAFSLMPSEIARLVYGYLLEKGCHRTAERFLDESKFLKEFSQGIREGYQYTTKINDRSLLSLLNGSECGSSIDYSTLKNSTMLQDDLNKINISLSNNSTEKATTLLEYLNHDLVEKIAASVSENLEKSLDKKINQCLPKPENSLLCTPNKEVASLRNVRFSDSPRRKSMTPKRISYSNHNHVPQNQLEGSSQLSGSNCDTIETIYPYSSPISSSVCDSPDIEVSIDRHLIYNECINNASLQEMLVNKINQKNMLNEPDKCVTTAAASIVPIISENDTEAKNNLFGQIFKSLESDQKYNQFIESIIDKELQTACFQMFSPSSNGTCTTSTSLNTPNICTPDFIKNFKDTPNKLDVLPVVKNLLNDLKTPEKINIYPVNSNSSIQISPPKGFEKNLINNISEHRIDNQVSNNNNNNNNDNNNRESFISNNLRSSSIKISSLTHQTFNNSFNEIQSNDSKMNNSNNGSRTNSQEHKNTDKYNRMGPVFANQHLQTNNKSGFSRIKQLQKVVHESKNNSTMELDSIKSKSQKQDQTNPTSQQQAPVLTTTIEKVQDLPNLSTANNNSQTFQEMKPIELYISNWSTPTNSSFIIPGLENKQGLILSSVSNNDQQQPVYYINNDNLGYSLINCSSSIQTINSNETMTYSSNANTLSMPLITSDITTTTNTVLNLQSKPTITQNQSSVNLPQTPPRTVPAILSKGKGKRVQLNLNSYKITDTENRVSEQGRVLPLTETEKQVNQNIDYTSTKTKDPNNENTKISRKSPILPKSINVDKNYKKSKSEESKDTKNKNKVDNKKQTKKRKFDEIHKPNKSLRHSSANIGNEIVHDPKIKTLLDADVDKFLVNIHGNKK